MRHNDFGWILLALVLSGPQLARAQQIRSATWSTDKFLLRYWTMLEPARPGAAGLTIPSRSIAFWKTTIERNILGTTYR